MLPLKDRGSDLDAKDPMSEAKLPSRMYMLYSIGGRRLNQFAPKIR